MFRHATTPLVAARRFSHATNTLIPLSSSYSTAEHTPAPKRSPARPFAKFEKSKSYSPSGKLKSKFPRPPGSGKRPSHDDVEHLLEPYALSQQIKSLGARGKVDEALLYLKNSPLDSQNVAVWNTMMSQLLKAGKYQLAYQTFVDMKRRGFSPTVRTYSTMMAGLARIQDWRLYGKQLENAHALFEGYMDYMEAMKTTDSQDGNLHNYPLNSYLNILGSAGLHQKLFDVYFQMDEGGPLAPDQYTYTTMFNALFERKQSPVPAVDILTQNASDAKVLWRRMLKESEQLNFPIDSHALAAALRVFVRGRPADQLLAFDIIRDYLGLAKPGETPSEPKLELNPHLFQIVLELCNYSKKHRLCIHWAQQVMDLSLGENPEPTMLICSHMEQVFSAYASLAAMGSLNESEQALEALQWMLKQNALDTQASHALKPTLHTYGLVMMTCWRGGDWASASRTFELLTGLSAKSFLDGNVDAPKQLWAKGLALNNVVASCMLRAAMASRDVANMRQCLRMLDHFGEEKIFSMGEDVSVDPSSNHSKRLMKDQAFYSTKLSGAVVDCVNAVLRAEKAAKGEGEESEEEDESRVTPEEKQRWLALRKSAKAFLHTEPKYAYVPLLEEQPLGSTRGLAATNNHIDFTLMSRNSGGANRRTG